MLSGNRAAVIAPMSGTMTAGSTADIGVAEKQQVAFTGIKSIFEKVLTLDDSIKLLSCFSVEDKNTIVGKNDGTTNVSPLLDVSLMASQATNFQDVLKVLFNEAVQTFGDADSNGMPVLDLLSDGMRAKINSLLSTNGLLDLLEASNVMNVQVTLNADAGALDMYKAISGTREGVTPAVAADIKAKRRLFLTQIPKATLESYLLHEETTAISFLPLKGGDSMTFVFDISVSPPSTITAKVKDATASNETGANGQDAAGFSTGNGGYLADGSAVTLLNATPESYRVAFIAHLGSAIAPFGQTYSAAQYAALPEPSSKTVAGYKAEFNKLDGAILAKDPDVLPASLNTDITTAKKNLRATTESIAASDRAIALTAYNAATSAISFANASIDEAKKLAALNELKAKRTLVKTDLDAEVTNNADLTDAFNTADGPYQAYLENKTDMEDAWNAGADAALLVLASLENKVPGLSQELENAKIADADARDVFYPDGGSTPVKKATLQAAYDAALTAFNSARATYESTPDGDANLAARRTAFNNAATELYDARAALARKEYIMGTTVAQSYANALVAAQQKVDENNAAISTKVSEYNAKYTTVHSSITTPTITGVAYVNQNSTGTRVKYEESADGVAGIVSAPPSTDLENSTRLLARLQTLYADLNTSINDAGTAANRGPGMQKVWEDAAKVLADVQAAEDAWTAAKQLYTSRFNGVSTYGSGGSVLASIPIAADALASAEAALAKAQAKKELLDVKLAAYATALAAVPATPVKMLPNKVTVA